jgi:molybdopterin/thiamine biosynthesis adenylyltransferase
MNTSNSGSLTVFPGSRIVVASGDIEEALQQANGVQRRFRCLDGETVYSAVNVTDSEATVTGTILPASQCSELPHDARPQWGCADDPVRISVAAPGSGPRQVRGFVRRHDHWQEVPVMIVPLEKELFSRTKGVFETDVLAGKCVFVPGQGSIGSHASLGVAELGVGRLRSMDHDRLEAANVPRHVLGLSDVGRFKTKAMADRIRDTNPGAQVRTCEQRITWDTQDIVRQFVRDSDLTICGVDDRTARVILNCICVEESKPLILAGAMRRAHGGQVLVVKPGQTPCYQCFLMSGLDKTADQEISTDGAAERLAYSDRPVAVEPGLSNDIAPITQMVVKLALQILLEGIPSTLHSLDEDLIAPWYLWLSR